MRGVRYDGATVSRKMMPNSSRIQRMRRWVRDVPHALDEVGEVPRPLPRPHDRRHGDRRKECDTDHGRDDVDEEDRHDRRGGVEHPAAAGASSAIADWIVPNMPLTRMRCCVGTSCGTSAETAGPWMPAPVERIASVR